MTKQRKYKKLRIEASSVCQLNCPSCPTARKLILPVIGKGFLRINDFQNLIDENRYVREIELSNYGEIFLNPDLLKIMHYAYKKNVLLTAGNGVNLNNVKMDVLEGLVKYQVRSLTCSIDGINQETYQKYRIGGNYDTVIKNIRKINKYKKKYRSIYPILTWQFIIFGHNEDQLQNAKNLAASLDMNFSPKLSFDSEFSPCSDATASREFKVRSRREYKEINKTEYMQHICNQLWEQPQINWNGKVLGCCINFWGDFGGNVFADGLIDALNNEKINYAMGMLLGKNDARDDIPCVTCPVYKTMIEYNKWLDRSWKRNIFVSLYRQMPKKIRYFIKNRY